MVHKMIYTIKKHNKHLKRTLKLLILKSHSSLLLPVPVNLLIISAIFISISLCTLRRASRDSRPFNGSSDIEDLNQDFKRLEFKSSYGIFWSIFLHLLAILPPPDISNISRVLSISGSSMFFTDSSISLH